MIRVVGTLTTIPGRYPKLLRTLKSLINQDYKLSAIYLSIPEQSRRLKQPYPELPTEITKLCTVVPCSEDYGPCTKIVGALLRENDPNTIIITFDDDVVYSSSLVSRLIEAHKKFPNSALGSSGILLKYGFPFYSTISNCKGNWNNMTGFELNENGRAVDALCGFSAVLYKRGFFPSESDLYDKFLKYPLLDDDIFYNDDIMISAYLSGQNIERRVIPNIPITDENKVFDPKIDNLDGNEISHDKLAFLSRFRNSIIKTQEYGFFKQTEPVSVDETIGGHIIIVFIFILLLILSIIVFYGCL